MQPAKADLAVHFAATGYRLPRVAFKGFPMQIELLAVAEAGCSLCSRIKGRVRDIRTINVETYPGVIERAACPEKYRPQTKGTADHSLPVCLAMALLDGDVKVHQFEKERWRAPEVLALVEKTTVKPSEVLMGKLPKGRGASIEVAFTNGPSKRETVEVPEGDAQRPLSRKSLQRKFMTFCIPVVGFAAAKRILAMVDSLDSLKDVRQLMPFLKGEGKQKPA